MGTHPIFESDFDCLTDVGQLTVAANGPAGEQRPGRDQRVEDAAAKDSLNGTE